MDDLTERERHALELDDARDQAQARHDESKILLDTYMDVMSMYVAGINAGKQLKE